MLKNKNQKNQNINDVVKNLFRRDFYNKIIIGLLIIVIVVMVLADKIIPQPVVVVDRAGNAVALLHFSNPYIRNTAQIENSVTQFLVWYYSHNTATIRNDTKMYMAVMEPKALIKRQQELIDSGVYALVEKSTVQSKLDILQYQLLEKGDLSPDAYWVAQAQVKLTVQGEATEKNVQTFFVKVRFQLDLINTANPLGITNVEIE